MTTLTTAPLAPMLRRLFEEDESAWDAAPTVAGSWSSLSGEERERLMRSKADYRDLYGRLKDVPLAVSRETGLLLYVLARSTHARSIVEFGTSFGVSTLHLAAALKDNGGGRLITSEFEPSKAARARDNLTAAGLIDLLLLDGAKGLYVDILDLLESRLAPGALILADDADHCPDYLERVRSAGKGYLSVPFADDIELSMRLG